MSPRRATAHFLAGQAQSRLVGAALILALVIVSTAVQLAVPDAPVPRIVVAVLQATTLILSLRLARAPSSLVRAAGAVGVAAIAGTVAAGVGGGDGGTSVARILNTSLVMLAPPALAVAVVGEIRASRQASLVALLGVLSIYLLIGIAFGLGYATVDAVGSQAALSSAPDVSGRSDFLYFSFVTLTTTGYGDLVPATDLVRSMAVVEALIGQIYLVTVVALLVGNLRARGIATRAASAHGG